MFYRNTGITGKTEITLSKVIKTMSDISIVMTLSTLPTKRCGLYSLTTQRTLGVDAEGHLCYWFYDGNNDRCLNGSTVLSGTNVKVSAVHSRNGVRLYVNGVLDAFCEAPLWSENVNTSYIGTHGLAPSDLEMDGEIEGALLTDYAMTDEEMSVVSWDSELCVVNNRLFYAPSSSTLHVGDEIASSLDEGSVYALEDMGSLTLSNEEKLPCWYLGEYNSTTRDITLNISDKRGGGTYNRMEVDHLVVHDIDVVDTGHVVEDDGEDVYPYLAVDDSNNAIFANPHINTMKVEYHCSATEVSDQSAITVWGSSYDETYEYIYARYTISYKDGASGIIVTTVKDPTHLQNMIRTVTCYVETTTSTYTWPTDPTEFSSYNGVSFSNRNARTGTYQFTRQWTWFGEEWHAKENDTVPTSSIDGFESGHWVSGSETATFVVDDDYLRRAVVANGEKVFRFYCSQDTYTINKRSRDKDDITVNALISGYNSVTTPRWSISEAVTINSSATPLQSSVGNVIIISIPHVNSFRDGIDVTMSATCDGVRKDYTFKITPNVLDNEIMFFNCINHLPNIDSGERFIDGDYFVASADFSHGGYTYNKGVCYVYSSASERWGMAGSEDSSKMLTALKKMIDDGVDLSGLSNNSVVSWFNNIVANNAIIEQLFSKAITLLSGGSIQSESYGSSDPQQFIIRADGSSEFDHTIVKNSVMENVKVTGDKASFECPSFAGKKSEVSAYDVSFTIPAANAETQYKQYRDSTVRNALQTYGMLPCRLSVNSNVRYANGMSFYDANYNRIEYLSYTVTGGIFTRDVFSSTFENKQTTVTVTVGQGDVFIIKSIPTSLAQCTDSGQVYSDNGTLKIKP